MASPDLARRLRDALTGNRPRTLPSPSLADRSLERAERAARVLGGKVDESSGGVTLTVDRECRPIVPSAIDTLERSSDELMWRLFDALAARPGAGMDGCAATPAIPGRRILFFDLETTGLAGGAGTQAFVIGFGWFEADRFRVRQLLLPGLDLERSLLEAAAREMDAGHGLVSYNGRSFDVPLIETRYLFHRMDEPFTSAPHLDLLHPARRLWSRDESCSLAAVERRLFSIERVGDVAGMEIPARYFTYLRSGDVTPLEAVLDHNRADLTSLAAVMLHLAWLYEAGPDQSRDSGECLGLGCLYERAGCVDRAIASYGRAASIARHFEDDVRLEAWHRRARLLRRQRRHAEAVAVWEAIAGEFEAASTARRDALQALAVHHEHRSRDLVSARSFTLQALRAERGRRLEAARHRLARLQRKLAGPEDTKSHADLTRSVPDLLDPSWS